MNAETSHYTYDPAGRLVRAVRDGDFASDVRYSYDSRGNRLSVNRDGVVTTSTYDHDDRLLTSGDLRFTYTAHGELLEKSNIVTGQKLTLTYDERGQLIRAILPSGQVVQYAIDGEGKRFAKTVGGAFIAAFVYDIQGRLVAELEPSGALKSRFIYATQSHSPDYMIQAGVNYYFLKDQLGSIRAVVNSSTDSIVQLLQYDEFGIVLNDSNPGFQPFGFAGGHYDHQTGLVRFGARDYDPEIGRWTSKDPILFAGGDTNLYGYTFSDPINFIDSDGEFAVPLVAGLVTAGILYFTPSATDTPGEGTNEITNGAMTIAGGALAAGAGGQVCKKGGKVVQAGANWLNRGRYLRIGAGRHDGRRVLRVAGDWVKWLENRGVPGIRNGHIDIKDLGPWTGR